MFFKNSQDFSWTQLFFLYIYDAAIASAEFPD